MLDAAREARGHLGDGILAINGDEIGERREQGGIGQHFRLDAVMQRLFPGVENVSQSILLLSPVAGAARWSSCLTQAGFPLFRNPGLVEIDQYTPGVAPRGTE